MDSPVLTQLFRQLFRHPACKPLRRSPTSLSQSQSRSFLTRATGKTKQDKAVGWTKRGDDRKDITKEYKLFPTVTANELRNRRERPRQVKMLTRDFVDGWYYLLPLNRHSN